MKKLFFGLIMGMAMILGLNSCSVRIDLLEVRCGIMEDGEPTPGNMNMYYIFAPDAFDAVENAVKEVAGSKFISMSNVPGQGLSFNGEDSRDVKKDIDLVVKKAKPAIEAVKYSSLPANRTFCIQYKYGMDTKEWETAYEYTYPMPEEK